MGESQMNSRRQASTHSSEEDEWAEKYAALTERLYIRWQDPLGIDHSYERHLKQELLEDYMDPLKRALVESFF